MKKTKNKNKIMREVVARCARVSFQYTVKGLDAVRLATLLKRNPHTDVLKPAVRRCSLNNFKNSQENICVETSF